LPYAFERLTVEPSVHLGLLILARGREDVERHEVRRFEPELNLPNGLKAPDRQHGRDQKEDGESGLSDDEPVPYR